MSEGTVPPIAIASLAQRRARQRTMFIVFVGLSLGLHLGLAAGWMFAPHRGKPALDLDEAIVKTRLVKLGKERPPDWLPRIDAAKPAPPPPTKKAPAKEPTPEKPAPDSKPKPSTSDILRDFEKDNHEKSVTDIIKERIGEPTNDGAKDGDKDGDALQGEIKKTYFQTLIAHIRKNMELDQTLSDEDRIRLKAVLSVKVDGDGNVLEARIQSSSGNSAFDNDVIGAAKRSSPVPAPPMQVRALLEQGVAFNFCPVSCS